jgi:two-component system CheB/CheR fusion protein
MREIFRRLRSEFELQAEAKGLRLLVDDCEDIVRTDPGLLEQIIQNLIANAIRYTKKGLVQLRCLHLQGKVRIEVLDTGIGIPVDELDTIFEEFYQLRREPGEQREGLGLGLSIVQRLTRLLDHPLEVESTPGEGTCFAVTLPRGTSSAVDHDDLDVTGGDTRNACRILLVDDNPAVLDATRILLELDGHDVSIASNTEEAVAGIEAAGIPDVVVADFHLGSGETGIDAIRQVRKVSGQYVPAVLVTGDTSSCIARQIEQTEPIQVFRKPVDTERLIAVIQELTSR